MIKSSEHRKQWMTATRLRNYQKSQGHVDVRHVSAMERVDAEIISNAFWVVHCVIQEGCLYHLMWGTSGIKVVSSPGISPAAIIPFLVTNGHVRLP